MSASSTESDYSTIADALRDTNASAGGLAAALNGVRLRSVTDTGSLYSLTVIYPFTWLRLTHHCEEQEALLIHGTAGHTVS